MNVCHNEEYIKILVDSSSISCLYINLRTTSRLVLNPQKKTMKLLQGLSFSGIFIIIQRTEAYSSLKVGALPSSFAN